jgi:hypothetical protein
MGKMTNAIRLSTVVVASLAVLGCVTNAVELPQPDAGNAGAVVVKIDDICLPLMPCANQKMVFARLMDGAGLSSSEIYTSTLEYDDHYYLLNAKPGTYVAVAASYSRGTSPLSFGGGSVSGSFGRSFDETIYFSQNLIEKTKVRVSPGVLAVAGDFDFDIQGRMGFAPSASDFLKAADPLQVHYAKTVDPQMETRGAMSSIKFYRADLTAAHTSQQAARKILGAANKHIGAAGWQNHILSAPSGQ